MDAPEAAKGETADDDGEDVVPDKQGDRTENQARRKPDPPALLPPPVFHLDNQGMTNTNTQEHGSADQDTIVIHTRRFSDETKRPAA